MTGSRSRAPTWRPTIARPVHASVRCQPRSLDWNFGPEKPRAHAEPEPRREREDAEGDEPGRAGDEPCDGESRPTALMTPRPGPSAGTPVGRSPSDERRAGRGHDQRRDVRPCRDVARRLGDGGDRERGGVGLRGRGVRGDDGDRQRPGHGRLAGRRVDQVVQLAVEAEAAPVASGGRDAAGAQAQNAEPAAVPRIRYRDPPRAPIRRLAARRRYRRRGRRGSPASTARRRSSRARRGRPRSPFRCRRGRPPRPARCGHGHGCDRPRRRLPRATRRRPWRRAARAPRMTGRSRRPRARAAPRGRTTRRSPPSRPWLRASAPRSRGPASIQAPPAAFRRESSLLGIEA